MGAEELRAALEFYADPENWKTGTTTYTWDYGTETEPVDPEVWSDGGEIARQALSASAPDTGGERSLEAALWGFRLWLDTKLPPGDLTDHPQWRAGYHRALSDVRSFPIWTRIVAMLEGSAPADAREAERERVKRRIETLEKHLLRHHPKHSADSCPVLHPELDIDVDDYPLDADARPAAEPSNNLAPGRCTSCGFPLTAKPPSACESVGHHEYRPAAEPEAPRDDGSDVEVLPDEPGYFQYAPVEPEAPRGERCPTCNRPEDRWPPEGCVEGFSCEPTGPLPDPPPGEGREG